jgi:hypothetical protein
MMVASVRRHGTMTHDPGEAWPKTNGENVDEMDNPEAHSQPSSSEKRSRGCFWLWVAFFGLLLAAGACTAVTFINLNDRGIAGMRISTARQLVACVLLFRESNEGRAPDTLEAAWRSQQVDNVDEPPLPSDPDKGWIYFKPSETTDAPRAVILVSMPGEDDHDWLRARRVIGWSDGQVELMRIDKEVPLPDGSKVRVGELH